MRIPRKTALIVFALFAGLCGGIVAYFFIGELKATLGAIVAAAISGGVIGWFVMPRVLFGSIWLAMIVGALVALLSHIPFSILWGAAMSPGGETFEFIITVATFGFMFAAIPQIVLGAIAGAVCYRRSVPYPGVG